MEVVLEDTSALLNTKAEIKLYKNYTTLCMSYCKRKYLDYTDKCGLILITTHAHLNYWAHLKFDYLADSHIWYQRYTYLTHIHVYT